MKKRSQIIREIDAVHRKVVLARDLGRCVTCGSVEGPQCSHFFFKGSSSIGVRWDIHPAGNCHIQCHKCHHEHDHQSRDRYESWFIATHGNTAFNELKKRANAYKRLSDPELLKILEDLTIAATYLI